MLKLIAFSPPDTLNYGWNEAQSALQQGHVFMGLLWNDQAPFLEDPKTLKGCGQDWLQPDSFEFAVKLARAFQPIGRT